MKVKLQVALLLASWLAIAAYQAVVTFLVDERFFAYRDWEYARIAAGTYGAPFRPFAVWDGVSHGDLSHMAGVPQLKERRRRRFSIDEYGYRNPAGALDRAVDVVVLGDSAAVGSQVDDGQILSDLVRSETGLGTYNLGGASFDAFLDDQRFAAPPPRLVLLVAAERVPAPEIYVVGDDRRSKRRRAWERSEVRVPRRYETMRSAAAVRAAVDDGRALRREAEATYKGLLWALGLYRLPPTIYAYDRASRTFFYLDGVHRLLDTAATTRIVTDTADSITRCHRALSERGIAMQVLMVPERETVYHDRIPLLRDVDAAAPLRLLAAELDRAGVPRVDVLDALQRHRQAHPDAEIYFRDDTHLTALGHRLLFEAVRDRLPRPAGAGA